MLIKAAIEQFSTRRPPFRSIIELGRRDRDAQRLRRYEASRHMERFDVESSRGAVTSENIARIFDHRVGISACPAFLAASSSRFQQDGDRTAQRTPMPTATMPAEISREHIVF